MSIRVLGNSKCAVSTRNDDIEFFDGTAAGCGLSPVDREGVSSRDCVDTGGDMHA